MDTTEAAQALGCTARNVRALCQRYDIGRKVGRDRILTEADVDTLRRKPWRTKTEARK